MILLRRWWSGFFYSRDGVLALLLALALVVYAGVFITRTSFVIPVGGDSVRAFVLFDDAMISMRYARNLAEGFGLVWNPGGDRVEGFTNPGWVLMMAAVHLLRVSELKVSLLVQIAGAVFLLFNLLGTYLVGRLVVPRSPAVALVAAAFTGLYYPLNYWGLTGMEVSLCALVTTVAMLLVLRGYDVAALGLLGISTWLRLDMVVVFGAVGLYCMVFGGGRRWWLAGVMASMLIAALGSQLVWRWMMYGETVPNTYDLKMTGFPAGLRVLRGVVMFGYFCVRSAWPLLLVGAVGLLYGVRRGKIGMEQFGAICRPVGLWRAAALLSPGGRGVALLGVCFGAQAVYSVYVGGDAWERLIACNRFVSVVIPAFFVLYAYGLYGMVQAVCGGRWRVVFFCFAVVSLVNFNSFPRGESLAQWVLLVKPTFTGSNQENLEFALAAKAATKPDARIAVDAAGVVPYFVDRTCIDLLGKCDKVVARGRMHRHVMTDNPLLEFYPGHLKWDYSYSIGQLQPDMVMSRWGRAKGDSDDFLVPDYARKDLAGVETWIRKDSTEIALPRAW